MTLSIIILAAGHGKRMNSSLPKVLHKLAGKTLLEHIAEKALQLKPKQLIIVHGYQGEMVQKVLSHIDVTWVEQKEQLGTGHAILQALPVIPDGSRVLMLYGDAPLIQTATLKRLIEETPSHALGIITAYFSNPTGIGRIIRDQHNKIVKVIEEKDASVEERQIKEVNTGFYVAPIHYLRHWLPHLKNHNAQKEYYLTDIIAEAVNHNILVQGMLSNHEETLGINDHTQLALAESYCKSLV